MWGLLPPRHMPDVASAATPVCIGDRAAPRIRARLVPAPCRARSPDTGCSGALCDKATSRAFPPGYRPYTARGRCQTTRFARDAVCCNSPTETLVEHFDSQPPTHAPHLVCLTQPCRWTSLTKRACKEWATDLDWWAVHKPHTPLVNVKPASSKEFACHLRHASFDLRKHLGGPPFKDPPVIAPTRLLARSSTCSACLKGLVERLQYRWKRASSCLRRTACLEPPLTTDELGGTEAAFNKAKQTVIKGKWELFSTTQVAEQAYGPRRLTSDEYLEAIREEIALRALARLFHPDPDFLSRVEDYISGSSTESSRKTPCRSVDRRPRFTLA